MYFILNALFYMQLSVAVITVVLYVGTVNTTWFMVRPPSQCSAPRSPDEKPFYFGSSDLFCTTTGVDISIPGLRRKRSAPARDVMELVHSWIYYDGLYFEFGVDPEYGFKMPFSSSSKVAMFTGLPYLGYKCPWRREPFPAGYSSLPVGCLQRCASRYEVFLGRYSTLFNNCHHFSNLISDILCSNQCPSWCDM